MKRPITTTSVFTMDDVHAIATLSLDEAKAMIMKIATDNPSVKPITVTKLRNEVSRTKTREKLMMTMANWILAHPSENLKVVK